MNNLSDSSARLCWDEITATSTGTVHSETLDCWLVPVHPKVQKSPVDSPMSLVLVVPVVRSTVARNVVDAIVMNTVQYITVRTQLRVHTM